MTEKENLDSLNSLLENYEKQKSIDAIADWKKLRKRIASYQNKRLLFSFLRNAAAILLPLFLAYQYVLQPVLNKNERAKESVTITSAPGMVTKTILPDGSEVWLNALSSLTYPQHFTNKNRTVLLSGEAYFKVSADKKRRFNVVMPDETVVSAFGTEFNIHAYQDEADYQVTLARGNIEVETARSMKKEELTVGQKAVLNPLTGEINIVQTDTYVETAWKDGKMVFRREKLETIAQKLSRKFGVIIRLEGDALKDYEYTATFTDETLEDILELLARSAPITYAVSRHEQGDDNTFKQRTVMIKSKAK